MGIQEAFLLWGMGLSILPGESSREVTASEIARPGNDAGSSSGFTQIDREPGMGIGEYLPT